MRKRDTEKEKEKERERENQREPGKKTDKQNNWKREGV